MWHQVDTAHRWVNKSEGGVGLCLRGVGLCLRGRCVVVGGVNVVGEFAGWVPGSSMGR
jgi:hypothetical protein